MVDSYNLFIYSLLIFAHIIITVHCLLSAMYDIHYCTGTKLFFCESHDKA